MTYLIMSQVILLPVGAGQRGLASSTPSALLVGTSPAEMDQVLPSGLARRHAKQAKLSATEHIFRDILSRGIQLFVGARGAENL